MKKSDMVRAAVAEGNFKKALKIAKDFRLGITKEQHNAIVRAYECIVYPEFYGGIGKDLQSEINIGKEILVRIYG